MGRIYAVILSKVRTSASRWGITVSELEPSAQSAPAGWYPNPDGTPGQRYWDGTAWASATAPAVVPAYRPTLTPQGLPISPKSRLAALLLAIFLGAFGVHSFYVGKVGAGIGQIAITVVSLGTLGWVWPLIDVILIAVGTYKDGSGRVVYSWDS
jgi:TM2 domain-containing membrane protein YozV